MECSGVVVSFDLYVWREAEPIGPGEARVKLERWGDGEVDVFAAHPAVELFYASTFQDHDGISVRRYVGFGLSVVAG
jgi:hypothetical protein